MVATAVVRALLCAAAAAAVASVACTGSGTAAVKRPARERSEVARREPFAVVEAGAVHAIARNATHLFWVDDKGLHRRPLGGPDAGKPELLNAAPADWGEVVALAAGAESVFLSDGHDVFRVPVTGGTLSNLVQRLDAVQDLVVLDDDHVYLSTATGVSRLAGDREMPSELAGGQVLVRGLTLAGDHLYWIDAGSGVAPTSNSGGYGPYNNPYAPPPPPATTGSGDAIRRVAVKGGPVQQLAGDLHAVGELAVAGGRVYWTSVQDPALQSVEITGGVARVEQSGRADGVLADDHGVVVRHINGLIGERRGGAPADLRLISEGTWFPSQRPMVATDDWLYLIATRSYDGTGGLLAVPRQEEGVEVVTTTVAPLMRLRAARGTLVWAESSTDGTGITLVRGDPRTGARRELGRHPGWLNELAIGGGQVYFADDSVIYRVALAGGAIKSFYRTDAWITGLTPHRNHVYWVNGSALYARKRSGGQAFQIARTEYGYGGGEPNADLVFDDDYVYLNTFGSTALGVYRISERGEVATIWSGGDQAYPTKDLIKFGDELFFAAGGAIYRLPLDGTAVSLYRAGSDAWISDLVGGGGLLYAVISRSEYWEIVRIDTSNGDARAVLRWNQYGNDQTPIDADDTGCYVYLAAFDAILRIAHDAPAIPAIGWPKHGE